MQLDPDWLDTQGDDASFLRVVDFPFKDGHPPQSLGIAVSGGGDSMALLHLYMRWSAQTGVPIAAVTVDHGLRDGSTAEAEAVAAFCAKHDVPHTTRAWTGWDRKGNLQAKARAARYTLIADWAHANGITHVVLGHTADDIAETFVMRLARKAGIDGLAAMDRQFTRNGVKWLRPFFRTSRDDLRTYLQRNDTTWIDDPSNEDEDFERVRARKAMAALGQVGVEQSALAHAAHITAEARDALDQFAQILANRDIAAQAGDLLLDLAGNCPVEMKRRLWAKAVQWAGRADYPPRAAAIAHLQDEIARRGTMTAGGCLITEDQSHVRITRELKAVQDLRSPTDQPWDTYWHLDGPHAPDLAIRALGDNIRQCPDWRATGLPRTSLVSTPAIYRGNTLIAAPIAGYSQDWSARIVADFHSFLLSH